MQGPSTGLISIHHVLPSTGSTEQPCGHKPAAIHKSEPGISSSNTSSHAVGRGWRLTRDTADAGCGGSWQLWQKACTAAACSGLRRSEGAGKWRLPESSCVTLPPSKVRRTDSHLGPGIDPVSPLAQGSCCHNYWARNSWCTALCVHRKGLRRRCFGLGDVAAGLSRR